MYIEQYQLGIAIGIALIAIIGTGILSYKAGKKNAARVAINVFNDCFVDDRSREVFSPIIKRFASQVGIRLKVTHHLYRDGKLRNDEEKSNYRNRPWTSRRYRVVNITDKSK